VLTRRRLLVTGLVGVGLAGIGGAASGCARRDPTLTGRPSPSPVETPPPSPADLAEHAGLEAGLASAAGRTSGLGSFAPRATDDFTAHARLLADSDRVEAAGSGSFADRAEHAARAHLAATASGETAARLASAGAYAAACAAVVQGSGRRIPEAADSVDGLAVLGDADALVVLLRQLHAAVFVADTALGHLTGSDAAWLTSVGTAHRASRYVVAAELDRRGWPVPAPEVAYDVGTVADAGDALALVVRTEAAVAPDACRAVRAVADQSLRATTAGVLRDVTVAAVRAGGSLPTWPGWV